MTNLYTALGNAYADGLRPIATPILYKNGTWTYQIDSYGQDGTYVRTFATLGEKQNDR